MNSIFSSNLKNLRLDNDYSQIQISKKLGLSRSTYSNYENGISEPNIDMIIKISKLFNCSIDDLLNNKVYTDILTKKPTLSIDLNKSDINQLKQKLINDKLYYENYLKIFNLEIPKKINDISALIYYLDNFNITSNISKLNIEINEVFASNISMQYTDNNAIDFSNYKNEVAEEIFPNIEPKTYTPILYVGKVSAGSPAFAFESIIDNYNIDSSKLCNCKDYFILKVDGDSMNKLYLDGELILIERTNLVNNNDLVIALVDNDTALFKRILIDSFSLGLKPESSNPIHETKWYKKENIHILGKVIGALKDYID